LGSTCTLGDRPGAGDSEKPKQTSGYVLKVKFRFDFCISKLYFGFHLDMFPGVCLALPQMGAVRNYFP